jgi:uncharacterized protein YjbI with pentapeptide repeats
MKQLFLGLIFPWLTNVTNAQRGSELLISLKDSSVLRGWNLNVPDSWLFLGGDIAPFYKHDLVYRRDSLSIDLQETNFQKKIRFFGFPKARIWSRRDNYNDTVEVSDASLSFHSTLDTFENIFHFEFDSIQELVFSGSIFQKNVKFENSKINYFHSSTNNYLADLEFNKTTFNKMNFSEFRFSNDSLNRLNFKNANLKNSNIIFEDCYIKDRIFFDKESYPNAINFNNLRTDGLIEFETSIQKVKTFLLLDKYFQVEKIRFNASNFILGFDPTVDKAQQKIFYKQILQNQKLYGTDEDVQAIEILIKDEIVSDGNVFMWFQKYLWNYGYDKYLLLKRLLSCLIIFYLINLFLFRYLITNVYVIEPIQQEYEFIKHSKSIVQRIFRYPILVLLYTSIIFFGLKMDINKFNLKYLTLALYLFLFYLLGLIFLFYSIGLVLAK